MLYIVSFYLPGLNFIGKNYLVLIAIPQGL